MKKRILFDSTDDLVIFKDSKSESIYGMTQDALIEKNLITEKYGGKEENVPDKMLIKVHPIKYVEPKDNYTDIYRPLKNELIEFPINQIEWVWIQVVKF